MPDPPRFVLVTGLSGAGKSQTLRFLEDLGYYCVDNLPVTLLPTFAELVLNADRTRRRIAVCVDVRSGDDLISLPAHLDDATEKGVRPDILYLESDDNILINRYSESRRRHPAAPSGSVREGIARERLLLETIRERADLVLDTSATSVAELRDRVAAMFAGPRERPELVIAVLSFGFKYGLPQDADLILDVRFLPNPYYDENLRPLTGNDDSVQDLVLNNPDASEFLERTNGLLKFLIPRYETEPKSYLTIAIGCTGGQHRSVAVAHKIGAFLRELNYNVRVRHRDITRADGPGG